MGRAHCEDSDSVEQAGQPGAARGGDASRPESQTLPPELGRKLGQVGKSLRSVFCSSPYFSLGLTVGSIARHGAQFLAWGLLWVPVPSPPSPWGGGSSAQLPLLFRVYWRSSRGRCRGPSAPPGAPAPPRPLRCPSPLPTPPPLTVRPESSRPHPVLYHQPLPFSAPLQLPRPSLAPPCSPLQKSPFFLQGPAARSLQRASGRDGWEWGWGA